MTIMKTVYGLFAAAFIMLPSNAVADAHSDNYVVKDLADVEFVPFGEGPVQIGVLWGDPATGPSGFLFRIPPGFESPIHAHSASYRAVVIRGQNLHWLENENRADTLPSSTGTYILQPGNQMHGDANLTDTESLILVMFEGPVDFILPE